MHVGDLDGTRSATKKSWSAKVTVAVHDASHKPVAGAIVTGSFAGTHTGEARARAAQEPRAPQRLPPRHPGKPTPSPRAIRH